MTKQPLSIIIPLLLVGTLLFGVLIFIARSDASAVSRHDRAVDFKAHSALTADAPVMGRVGPDGYAVAPPPFTPGVFPCSGCHEEFEPNATPRKLKKKHKEIVLHHGDENRWCTDCHTVGNIDKLHLASGELIDFTESYKLCGQCHGPTLRDWKAGAHGKRTGSWSGEKQYLLCASCHNPHSPKFQPLKPLPPPVRPRDLR
jgi:hypothetical protein